MPLETLNLAAEKKAGKSNFKPTAEELTSIQEKMKDPKFVELMHEYMQSLQDPETLREEEEYLEQAEREAREGGDYSFEFVFPRAGFVVELMKPTTQRVSLSELRKVSSSFTEPVKNARSFINMCSSDKVKEFREETTGDRMGSNWHVPVSVSQKRVELFVPNKPSSGADNNNNTNNNNNKDSVNTSTDTACYVYDAVYHPSTLSLADRSDKFLCFLVEIAVEHINNGYKESNGFEFSRLPSNVASIGQPKNQTVRSQGGVSPFDVDRNAPVLTKPTKHFDDATEKKKSTDTTSKGATSSGSTATAAAASSSKAAAAALPPHTIAHRGRIDMADAWQWKVSDKRVGVPEELIVKMTFAKVKRASSLDIDITEDGSAIRVSTTADQSEYEGLIVMPFTVEGVPVSAKFDKTNGVLTLTLKVIPPAVDTLTAAVAEELKERYVGGPIGQAAAEEAAPRDDAVPEKQTDNAPVAEAVNTPTPAEAVSVADKKEEECTVTEPIIKSTSEGGDSHKAADVATATELSNTTTTAAASSAAPVLEHIGDNDRAAAMMQKVAEARKAREAAAAAAAVDDAPSSAAEKHVDVSAPPSEPASSSAKKEEEDDIPFIQKKPATSAAEDADLAALQARQEAWAAMIQDEMSALAARDAAEAEEAARAAEADASKAKKKLEKMRELEAMEAHAQAKMKAVPLSNKYIFTID